jgi:Bacterial Ig domain/Beta-propeller repeat
MPTINSGKTKLNTSDHKSISRPRRWSCVNPTRKDYMKSLQKSLISSLIVALVLTACGGTTGTGGGGGGGDSGGDFSVAGPSATPTVAAGATVAVPIAVTRTGGFAGAVTVDLASPPSGVTVTQLSVATGISTGDLNIFVPSSVPVGPLALTLNTTAIGFSAKTTAMTLNVTGSTGAGGGDTTVPTVTLESIANVTTESTITLRATASDNVAVSKVDFYDGTTKLGEDTSSPYSWDLPVTLGDNGTKSFAAKAFDAAGNNTTSAAQAVTVSIPGLSQLIASSASDRASGIVRDSSGNVYVVGDTLGNLAGISADRNVFVRKFGPSGTVDATWGITDPGNQTVTGHTAGVDASGNLYVAGMTDTTIDGLRTSGGRDVFLRKYTPLGIVVWTRLFHASNADPLTVDDRVTALAVDPSGNIFLTGTSNGMFTDAALGTTVDATYLVKYSPDGTVLWTQQFRNDVNTGNNFGGVVPDGSGNVYITGSTIDPLEGSNQGGTDIFVRKYHSDGTVIWTSQVGGSEDDLATGISLGSSTNDFVYVSGSTRGSLVGTNSGGSDAVIYRCTQDDGACVPWQQFGTIWPDYLFDITTDAAGRITVVGNTGGIFPGNSANNSGLIRQYEADGTVRWTRQSGTGNPDVREWFRTVIVDASGQSYIAGYTEGAAGSLLGTGAIDAILRSYTPLGTLR